LVTQVLEYEGRALSIAHLAKGIGHGVIKVRFDDMAFDQLRLEE
jgi:hypothetical protein